MDPTTAIVAAISAGAAASAKGIAGDAVSSLYAGLKKLIAGRLASLAIIEDDPHDDDFLAAARKEVAKKGLADDPAVMDHVGKLTEALEHEAPDRLASAGIDISQIRAARGVAIRNLEATDGGVRVRGVEAVDGDVEISGVKTAAPPPKKI